MKHNPTDVQSVKVIHSDAAQILAAFEFYSREETSFSMSAENHNSTFGWTPESWLHKIEIYKKCQERLAERYCKLMTKLFNNDF